MKKQIQSLRYLAVAILLMATFITNANDNAPEVFRTSCIDYKEIPSTFNYSWDSSPGAVKYTLEIKCVSTNKIYNWKTSETSVSQENVDNGTYNLKLTAHYANSSIIIIEEVIMH